MGKYRYGVILDAGSSGTRAHVYRWLKSANARAKGTEQELNSLPVIKTKDSKWTKKIKPGITDFSNKASSVGPEYLQELLDFAQGVIPKDDIQGTPIFLLATAGMRLLEEVPRNALLAESCRYIKQHSKFTLDHCDLQVKMISGETEGLYGWIAANYLVGGLDRPDQHDHGKGHHTYGFLEMGGASAQIAYAPNSTETEKHANDLKLIRLRHVNGESAEYRVFVTTFLGYGAKEARKRFVQRLLDSASAGEKKVPDPCLPVGLEVTTEGTILEPGSREEDGVNRYLLGTGRFDECITTAYPLLDKEAACPDSPCLFHGVHAPALDFDVNHFIGVSNFWHGVHDIFNMGHKDAAYDFHEYQRRVEAFCNMKWQDILQGVEDDEWTGHIDEEDAVETCFKASWLINILHEGIGIPRVAIEGPTDATGHNGTEEVLDKAKQDGFLLPFQAVNKIDDSDVDWTLGQMVLYASSQVPAANDDVLSVGIGFNASDSSQGFEQSPDKPEQAKGPEDPLGDPFYNPMAIEEDYDPAAYGDNVPLDEEDDNFKLRHLFNAENLRRTPGFVLFLVILAVVGILLCGRERRANLGRKIVGLFKRDRGRGGAIQLGKTSGSRFPFGLGRTREQKYDRLMEEGDIPNPQDFELQNISSSEEDKDSHSSKGSVSSVSSSSGQSSLRRKAGTATPRKSATPAPLEQASSSAGTGQASAQSLAPASTPNKQR